MDVTAEMTGEDASGKPLSQAKMKKRILADLREWLKEYEVGNAGESGHWRYKVTKVTKHHEG